MSDKAFFVDTTKCSGCRACQVACKQWNGLPAEKTEFFGGVEYTNPANLSAYTWNHVRFFPLDRSNPEKPVWTIMHTKCNHCKDANCVKICPEKAISHVDGWVVIDQNKCIGCGACERACVYNVPRVSARKHVSDTKQVVVQTEKSHKCNACMVNKRDIPACVSTCPTGALTFGERPAILKQAQERLEQVKKEFPRANVYGITQFGGLRVITLLKEYPDKLGLPVDPKPIEYTKAEDVNDMYHFLSMFSFGLPSLKRAAYRISKSLGSKDA